MTANEVHVRRIREGLEQLQQFRVNGIIAHDPAFQAWRQRVRQSLLALFGSHQYVTRFANLDFCAPRVRPLRRGWATSNDWTALDQAEYDKDATLAESLLSEALEELPDLETSKDPIWDLLHPEIGPVARTAFDAGLYANAAEDALKHVNAKVKKLVRTRANKELDGADLMNQAFSPKNPIVVLDDLSTESGRNIQQGYMQIFAGAMTGIRNPKAHEILTITKERALHHLFLASLLLSKLEERNK